MTAVTTFMGAIISYQNLEENYNHLQLCQPTQFIISYQNLEENYNTYKFGYSYSSIISYQNLEENYNFGRVVEDTYKLYHIKT